MLGGMIIVYTVHLLHARAADSAYLVKRLAKTRVFEGHSGCVSHDISVCSGCVHVHVYTYTYIVHVYMYVYVYLHVECRSSLFRLIHVFLCHVLIPGELCLVE